MKESPATPAFASSEAHPSGLHETQRPSPALAEGERPIVFFDGVCALCNREVDRLLRADRNKELRFAPLQGETARRMLPPQPADPESWSVVYLDEAGLHERSEAALRICRRLGGGWRVLSWLRIVPRFLRDAVYRWVARNRYRRYGKLENCRVPAKEEKERFLT